MKYSKNIRKVAALKPDFLGFIFYKNSRRNFKGHIPFFSKSIKKVGVFVNENIENIMLLTEKYKLDIIQLHGDESVEYIKELNQNIQKNKKNLDIIKAFGIKKILIFLYLNLMMKL